MSLYDWRVIAIGNVTGLLAPALGCDAKGRLPGGPRGATTPGYWLSPQGVEGNNNFLQELSSENAGIFAAEISLLHPG